MRLPPGHRSQSCQAVRPQHAADLTERPDLRATAERAQGSHGVPNDYTRVLPGQADHAAQSVWPRMCSVSARRCPRRCAWPD